MHDAVRAELIDLVRTGGRNLCTMPRVLVAMLRERCPDDGAIVSEIERALDCGCVSEMLQAIGPIDAASLAAELSGHSDLPDRARWVIDSWVLAIAAADEPPAVARDWSAWNGLAAQGDRRGQRAVLRLCTVALAGAAGGGTLKWIGSPAWHDAVEGLPAGFGPLAIAMLGYLGGATGGGLAWMAANGRTKLTSGGGGTSMGRLAIGCLGAGIGALAGAPTGLNLFGLAGIMFGSMVGAFAGGSLAVVAADYLGRARS